MAFAPPNTLTTNAAAAIDVVLTQEASRIGSDIHKATLHTSPWIDLIKQTTFPEGMGYQLNTLVYDRALPLSPVNKDLSETGTTVGVSWSALGTTEASGSNGFTGGQQDQTNAMGSGKANVNVIDFTKTLKSYSLSRAVIESPRINVEELRYAAHRTEQLRAIMDLLKESVRNSWEERYRDEYAKLCDNVVICKASGTAPATGKEGSTTPDSAGDVDADNNNSAELIAANISNKVLDDLYFKLVRAGAGFNAYGRENGRPVFSLVCSSEASYQIMTESESIKDDIRFNNSRVSELIAPLGVEKSFRGYYHLVDDLAPRYSDTVDASDKLVKLI